MDLLTSIKISASGLSAQRTRLNVLSSNLANANSTQSADGSGPYKRKDPIFQEVGAESFEKKLDRAYKKVSGVSVREIAEDQTPGERVYDPSHPDADESGYVTMPNVNVVNELTDIMQTSSSYEANVAAIRSAKEMINAVLAIGRDG
ncbi:MAG: flagellar basal body rod protein FlgC [Deltaproteobacteria bacterium CG11_big_fil_rev_8_21_14_0_20_45_16]|nr:MAG: flagellar basal body rod protein FlgC [Deltaproteobacteria bacterium CG11_big_fil_rev_8_21_14_0_20_45_16]